VLIIELYDSDLRLFNLLLLLLHLHATIFPEQVCLALGYLSPMLYLLCVSGPREPLVPSLVVHHLLSLRLHFYFYLLCFLCLVSRRL
jgi:hypothetical protein